MPSYRPLLDSLFYFIFLIFHMHRISSFCFVFAVHRKAYLIQGGFPRSSSTYR